MKHSDEKQDRKLIASVMKGKGVMGDKKTAGAAMNSKFKQAKKS